MPASTVLNPARWTLKARLGGGFAALLVLMLGMAAVGAAELLVIRDHNAALDARALRLGLANQWLVEARIAAERRAPGVTSVDGLVDQLQRLVAAPSERAVLEAAIAQRSRPAADTVPALEQLTAELVRLQAADSGELQAANAQALWTLGVLSITALLSGSVLAWTITRSITRPLARACRATERIAAGELYHEVLVGRRDELGALLSSVADMQARLRATLVSVRNAADGIHTASAEIATGNLDLSQRTETTASNLQQTASSMESLTSTVRQSAASAGTANQLVATAAGVAQRGGEVVAGVVTTMGAINASSKKIADIIGVIDAIAFQTNILALNAAVESARAGEQGRGFAVVASEVRSLAQRSAEAAKEIKVLIGTSVEKVETGTRLVQDAGSTMDEIVASVQRVSDMIGVISSASAAQSAGIAQISGSVTHLDQMTQQNSALVEQSAAAAESLKHQAHELTVAMTGFKLERVAG